ncbi:hypothetical protein P3T24_004386 [Paraburkholderia sp. GAS33]|uniref:hypothetical protein n=1 Tax=Paraburkholderia sp. GAS33 TaxID=3035130 RepID=UPI003D195651
MKHRSAITLEDAEFIINNWRLTVRHKQASRFILDKFRGLQKEAAILLDEIEQLQPPRDTSHLIPVGDYNREISVRDRTIAALRAEVADLQRKCAAHTLYCGKNEK